MVDDDQPHPDDDVLTSLLAGEPAGNDAERARRAPYERIIDRIATLPPIEPPADSWQDLADRATRAGLVERPRPRWKPVVAGGALAAAAAVLLWVWLRDPGTVRPPEAPKAVAVMVERDGEPMRASGAVVGDVLMWTINLPHPVVEVRIYRDEETLVLRCPGADGCPSVQPGPPRMQGRLRLDRSGSYRVVAIGGDRAAPPPSDSVNVDLATLQGAGFTVDGTEILEVR